MSVHYACAVSDEIMRRVCQMTKDTRDNILGNTSEYYVGAICLYIVRKHL